MASLSGTTGIMEEEYDSRQVRRGEQLKTDILVEIFQKFSVDQLTLVLARVCRAWRAACRDPVLWKTLDFSHMKSTCTKIPLKHTFYVERKSDEAMTRILKISMDLSGGNTRTLIFNYKLFLTDDQLTYTAKRCPGLRRLVLPAWYRITQAGICKTMRIWEDLESITMPTIDSLPKIADPLYLFTEIAKNCKNFKELKIMGPFDMEFANTLITCLPNLKTLSLRCSEMFREALIKILDGLPGLEVLNISHSHFMRYSQGPFFQKVIFRDLDKTIMEKASRLKMFLTCMEHNTCVMCQRTEDDEGYLRWSKCEEGAWKVDEVTSLHLSFKRKILCTPPPWLVEQ